MRKCSKNSIYDANYDSDYDELDNNCVANAVVSDCQESFWIQSHVMQELKTFSNDLIKTIGVIKTSIKYNDCVAANVNVTVVQDGHRPIIGRGFFSQLGLSLTQSKQVLNVEKNNVH